MTKSTTKIPISDIIPDEEIYPRERIDQKRVGIFAENIRDNFKFEPIEVEPHPKRAGKYRILDGAHRWSAYKATGVTKPEVIIKYLDGTEPLLYAATKAIGPRQLNEEETKNTARRAFQNNPGLTSLEIGKAIGRSRRAVDSYIADLRAAFEMELDIKIFKMNRPGIPQERIAKRLGFPQQTISYHLPKTAELPFLVNTDLSGGFTISQVAEKHGWPEPLVWSVALQDKDDLERFEKLSWELKAWDYWYWRDCDKRFSNGRPDRIPAQLIAHILYYLSKQKDLVFDPMGGGGVTSDVCLAFNRRCWALDMKDSCHSKPEIEHYYWGPKVNAGSSSLATSLPFNSKDKPDLVIFDPPSFGKKPKDCPQKSISELSRQEYLKFFEDFFVVIKQYVKITTTLAFIIADWRDFQNKSTFDECTKDSLLIFDYLEILNKTGWLHTHVIQAPMSPERFEEPEIASAMQKKKSLGVTTRHVVILKQER